MSLYEVVLYNNLPIMSYNSSGGREVWKLALVCLLSDRVRWNTLLYDGLTIRVRVNQAGRIKQDGIDLNLKSL